MTTSQATASSFGSSSACPPRKLLLTSDQSPGDVVMLTAAVRELHRAWPGRFRTGVRTTAMELWENNPWIEAFARDDPDVETIAMHYPLIHQSNLAPYHFIHGYTQYLEEQLQVRIPVTEFRGDIHLSSHERNREALRPLVGGTEPYWILMAGGKFDFTAKWWNPAWYQKVVDHFAGRVRFIQCGESHHWHPPLTGVVNLVGQTTTRQFVQLMHHAEGVLCPVTFAMHLAAAVPMPAGKPLNRACVVIAGGREPPQWEAYPHHQFLSTNGSLWCCDNGGCWKSRCQPVGDGDEKDNDLCILPVAVTDHLQIPRCMSLIRPEDVIRRVELYYEGGALSYLETAA